MTVWRVRRPPVSVTSLRPTPRSLGAPPTVPAETDMTGAYRPDLALDALQTPGNNMFTDAPRGLRLLARYEHAGRGRRGLRRDQPRVRSARRCALGLQ